MYEGNSGCANIRNGFYTEQGFRRLDGAAVLTVGWHARGAVLLLCDGVQANEPEEGALLFRAKDSSATG